MRHLRLTLLALAALSAIFLGAGFLQRALRSDGTTAQSGTTQDQGTQTATSQDPNAGSTPGLGDIRKKLETTIAATPDYARFFDRLKTSFPTDYSDILDGLARGAVAAKKDPSPDALLADAVASLRRTNGTLAAKAQDDALAQIFVMQLKEMQALAQRDVHLCVAFLYGSNGPGFLDFAATHRDLVADAAISGVDAMASGRQNPANRGMPSDNDFQTLDRALSAKGLSRAEIETLLDGKTANPPVSDERMCAAGQTYLQSLGELDPAMRGRLYSLAVGLMAKS